MGSPLLGLCTSILHHSQDPLFLKLTISRVNRRLNRNCGPDTALGEGGAPPPPPPTSFSWRFHQGNKRSGIRDTMLPIQVSRAAPRPQLPLLLGDL